MYHIGRSSTKPNVQEAQMTRLMILSLGLLGAIGCASSGGNIQRESEMSIGDVMPEDVVVTDVQRGASSVKWTATTAKGVYSCSADDMMRRVLCVKRKKT